MVLPLVDIHCHLLPAIDDGAANLDEAVAMARMAVEDGIQTVIATPHQLGNFPENQGDDIRQRVFALQEQLDSRQIPLQILAGGDVRIEDGMVEAIRSGEVVTLADRRRHVLLELPHEFYFSLEPVLTQLAGQEISGILSHPERNQGILRQPAVLGSLVEAGCLMQVTAGSLCGTFGKASKKLACQMVCDGLVHFVATDAHGIRVRRPRLSRAFRRVVKLVGREAAEVLFCDNPARVAEGRSLTHGRLWPPRRSAWMGMRKVGR
jgi:protein-tyrosine phosphatase